MVSRARKALDTFLRRIKVFSSSCYILPKHKQCVPWDSFLIKNSNSFVKQWFIKIFIYMIQVLLNRLITMVIFFLAHCDCHKSVEIRYYLDTKFIFLLSVKDNYKTKYITSPTVILTI